jgi:hypothetical protein
LTLEGWAGSLDDGSVEGVEMRARDRLKPSKTGRFAPT